MFNKKKDETWMIILTYSKVEGQFDMKNRTWGTRFVNLFFKKIEG
jgi:hypothetical protein